MDFGKIARATKPVPNCRTRCAQGSFELLEHRLLLTRVISVTPEQNDHSATAKPAIVVSFDEAIATHSLSSTTLVVHGDQTGQTTSASFSVSDGIATITPDVSFHPGERIQATATNKLMAHLSGEAVSPYVWQFHTAATGGTGFFNQIDQQAEASRGAARDVAMGDLDSDGDVDAFVVFDSNSPGQVWLNDGGAFTSSESSQRAAESVELGDVDGDGDLDAFLSGRGVRLRLNDGNGTFGEPVVVARSITTDAILADLDGDGDLDGVTAGSEGRVWVNDGAGIFVASQLLQTTATNAAIGDLDNDGDLDLLLTGGVDESFVAHDGLPTPSTSVWLNDGKGMFRPGQSILAFGSVELGDVDDDGDLDALLGGRHFIYDGVPTKVWINDGNATFSESPAEFTNASPFFPFDNGARFADVDGDGDLDVLTSAGYLWSNHGNGEFQPVDRQAILPLFVSSDLSAFAFGDMDGDADVDVFAMNMVYDSSGPKSFHSIWANADVSSNLSVVVESRQHGFIAGESHETNYKIEVHNEGPVALAGVDLSVEFDSQLT